MGRPLELVLASGSPRRRELLSSLGWPFSVLVPSVDESLVPGERPGDAVKRLSLEKAVTAAKERPGSWVVAADTVVALGNRILGKPAAGRKPGDTHPAQRQDPFDLHGRYGGVPGDKDRHREDGRPLPELRIRPPGPRESGRETTNERLCHQGLGALLVDSIREIISTWWACLCRLSES